MPAETDEFADLINRARNGDQDAAKELYDKYAPHVLLVIRRHLNKQVRSVLDSTDLLQSVWIDVFKGMKQHGFQGPDEFLAYLTRLAQNTVGEAHRKQLDAQKRTRTRHEGLSEQAANVADPSPSPLDLAASRDHVDFLARHHPEPRIRRILMMYLQGHTVGEIAKAVAVSERTIQRLLQGLREPAPAPH
jgi:RNA polymerase sigma-70 factor, ECF subfamily